MSVNLYQLYRTFGDVVNDTYCEAQDTVYTSSALTRTIKAIRSLNVEPPRREVGISLTESHISALLHSHYPVVVPESEPPLIYSSNRMGLFKSSKLRFDIMWSGTIDLTTDDVDVEEMNMDTWTALPEGLLSTPSLRASRHSRKARRLSTHFYTKHMGRPPGGAGSTHSFRYSIVMLICDQVEHGDHWPSDKYDIIVYLLYQAWLLFNPRAIIASSMWALVLRIGIIIAGGSENVRIDRGASKSAVRVFVRRKYPGKLFKLFLYYLDLGSTISLLATTYRRPETSGLKLLVPQLHMQRAVPRLSFDKTPVKLCTGARVSDHTTPTSPSKLRTSSIVPRRGNLEKASRK
ncbi:hypothetical protein BDP27DRAFT_1367050 [Rhodocollybia butyracea]|uniref:Uncharacterized protein n=1 Tax=Rhodocollybia butyracea TaxID=206335 RepID=A0A9P5U2G6_9AGAR|nr:hypothetical protein BDP27DRAFT_1367050 [Rhodocollybia butyracea]